MSNELVLLPIVIPLAGAAVGILIRRRHRVQMWWSLGALVAALAASFTLLVTVLSSGQPSVWQLGAWSVPFGITLVADALAVVMAVMCQIVLVAGLLYALGCRDKCVQYPSFFPLFLTLATGLTGAMLTGDLFNLFVFAELVVISGTILTAISDDTSGVEAAFKYFFISLLASTLLLIAIGSLYASYGTLNMADLARRIALEPDRPLLPMALAALTAAFLIKGAVFPFHFWQPDFHSASPTAVSSMLSSVVVKIGVYGLLRMTTLLFVDQAGPLRGLLVVLGLSGILFGGLAAIGTQHAKRMLAYSTLGQLGFILVAIGWGTPLSLLAAVVFAFNHALLKSAMLMLAGNMASRAPIKTAAFNVIGGLGKMQPQAGALFLLGGMGLAGLPPMNGFLSKWLLFNSGLDAQEFGSLALVAAGSVFTLIYIVRAFQKIWWEPPAEGVKAKSYGDRLLAPALLIGLSLFLGLWGEPLLKLAQAVVDWMGMPAAYIQAVLGV